MVVLEVDNADLQASNEKSRGVYPESENGNFRDKYGDSAVSL